MAEHTDAEQEHRAGLTELTGVELGQVSGGQGGRPPFQPGPNFPDGPPPFVIVTPAGLVRPGEGRPIPEPE